ncbi:MAG: cation diffusion facilitator family transporter [Bacteroidaceae bacterium]|nr:cation diffusion facilitator family transporter [Bacteroidaceae bacterium]
MYSKMSSRERGIFKVTILGSLVNLFLLIIKFFAAFVGNSAAMLADAIHSFSDFITDLIVLVFSSISSKPQDKGHDYGHGKYETMATVIIGLALFAVGLGIFFDGSLSIYKFAMGSPIKAPGMIAFIVALFSIILKEWLYRYTIKKGKILNSQPVVANAWHHRSDAFSSIGTALGIGGAILFGEHWRVLDPIAAVVVSILIIRLSVLLLIPCIGELLEQSLPDTVEEEIMKALTSFPGVSDPHHLRTRRIGSYYAIEVHVRMDGNIPLSEAHAISSALERKIRGIFGQNTIINIHVEPKK